MLTMSTAAKRTPTFEELYREIERLPQGITGQILVAGVLTTMSRPGSPHEHTLAHCERALDRFDRKFDGNGWWIRQEFEVRFPGDRLAVPDLAGWRSDRYPELPDDNPLRAALVRGGPVPQHGLGRSHAQAAALRLHRRRALLAARPGASHAGGLRVDRPAAHSRRHGA
jgi:hypothetical protein